MNCGWLMICSQSVVSITNTSLWFRSLSLCSECSNPLMIQYILEITTQQLGLLNSLGIWLGWLSIDGSDLKQMLFYWSKSHSLNALNPVLHIHLDRASASTWRIALLYMIVYIAWPSPASISLVFPLDLAYFWVNRGREDQWLVSPSAYYVSFLNSSNYDECHNFYIDC